MSSHTRPHGQVRGLESTGRSPQFEGRFGRIFRTLPPANFTESALSKLAAAMIAPHEDTQTPETEPDDEENAGPDPSHPAISAGYTYLGQFIDHDLTFDPASSLQKANDPDALVDFRTPRFDIDCVYGRGPDDQPYLYLDDGKHLLQGRPLSGNPADPNTRDLPRNNPDTGPRRALIGDPRNDENVIVSQLQGTMIRFHNHMVDLLGDVDFGTVQRLVRWHYQWVVLRDFLPTIIGEETLQSILPHLDEDNHNRYKADLRFYKPKNDPFMPVEFSVGAYRFGHSMVRPIYRLNTTLPDRQVIFSNDPSVPNLTGFKEFPDTWAIDWSLFFDFGGEPPFGPTRIQPAYKIDSSLVNPLGSLPPSIGQTVPSLAFRNLMRGWRMGLPSGQSVARQMGLTPIPDDKLKVGKAIEGADGASTTAVEIDGIFEDNAPLWFYILAEAQQQSLDDSGNVHNDRPIHLGPVGGRIVGETFVGLLLGDRHSFLNQEPMWEPLFLEGGQFGIVQLIKQAHHA